MRNQPRVDGGPGPLGVGVADEQLGSAQPQLARSPGDGPVRCRGADAQLDRAGRAPVGLAGALAPSRVGVLVVTVGASVEP